ncbi:MAG: hypothetical protein AB7D33_14015 [Sphingobium sp.]
MTRHNIWFGSMLMTAAIAVGGAAGRAGTETVRPSLMDSFRIGTGGSTLCQAQSNGTGPATSSIFDRA